MPVEPELFGDIADRSAAATPANVKGKSLGVERIVREEVETLALHLTALAAPNAPHLELQKYAQAASRKVANSADLAVVPSGMFSSACAAGCFFERRTRAMMRACGSPNTPRTSSIGRKPENRYASSKRRRFVEVTRIRPRCRHQSTPQHPLRFASEIREPIEANKAVVHGLFTPVLAQNSPTRLHEDPHFGSQQHLRLARTLVRCRQVRLPETLIGLGQRLHQPRPSHLIGRVGYRAISLILAGVGF